MNNFCKILLFWIFNLILEFFIKFTYQINAVINCFFLIIVHILIIEKNLNYLLNFSMLLCFNWYRKNHICLKFHKLIICNAIRTEFFMPLLMITATTSLLKIPLTLSFRTGSSVISSISYIISAALTSVFNPVTERRDLKVSLISIQIKREVSKRGRFRNKNLFFMKHYWSRYNYEF